MLSTTHAPIWTKEMFVVRRVVGSELDVGSEPWQIVYTVHPRPNDLLDCAQRFSSSGKIAANPRLRVNIER